MPVRDELDRWTGIVRSALEEVVPGDDEVVFHVTSEASMDMDPDAPVEKCDGCGEEHAGLAMFVLITIALISPPENPTMTFRVTQIMDIAEAENANDIRTEVLRMWNDLAFQRQAATMPDIDLDQTG